MATPAQIAANQRNAQKSTGPATPEAKARTRRNATRHGLCSGVALQNDEDPEEFETLHADLRIEHQPEGPTEDILVYKMAESFWFSWRASILLAEHLDINDEEDDSKQVSLMLRYHTTADRSFLRHLNELRKLQKERRLEEIGIVSQNPESHPPVEAEAAPAAATATPVTPPIQPSLPVPPLSTPSRPPKPLTGGPRATLCLPKRRPDRAKSSFQSLPKPELCPAAHAPIAKLKDSPCN